MSGTRKIQEYREDFPILSHSSGDERTVYLDSAATSQRPRQVLDAMTRYYETANANPHRGVYALAVASTEAYEGARSKVASFIGAASPQEIIFTRNTTESINLIAWTYARSILKKGDEVVIPVSEHHSNLVPWQIVCAETGASLVYLYLDDDGYIRDEDIKTKITARTKIVAFAVVSNVLGVEVPVRRIVEKAHEAGAVVIADCAQSIPHERLDVQALDLDFATFSGHKMFAPLGIGVLYGKKDILKDMPPFLTGGDMIEYVTEQHATFAPLPQRFEAGTQNVEGAVGLAAAIDYIEAVGYDEIRRVEKEVTDYALDTLGGLPWIHIYGKAREGDGRYPVMSFTVDGIHPHDVASILDTEGVAIRAGHHCAQPLMQYLGAHATCRASISIYNTREDIDALVAALKKAREVFGYGS
nr:cysteine desulfurase [Parasphaerochaeta coccoides]